MAEYIEREALIEKCKAIIQDKWNDKVAPVSWSHAYADFIEDIENQPTADVAPVVHGHWIRQDESFTRFKCSNPKCGIENCNGFENYCPHCGTKMDEGKGDFIE